LSEKNATSRPEIYYEAWSQIENIGTEVAPPVNDCQYEEKELKDPDIAIRRLG
jgi:hypothetical protein